jgi:hypothetical protein
MLWSSENDLPYINSSAQAMKEAFLFKTPQGRKSNTKLRVNLSTLPNTSKMSQYKDTRSPSWQIRKSKGTLMYLGVTETGDITLHFRLLQEVFVKVKPYEKLKSSVNSSMFADVPILLFFRLVFINLRIKTWKYFMSRGGYEMLSLVLRTDYRQTAKQNNWTYKSKRTGIWVKCSARM